VLRCRFKRLIQTFNAEKSALVFTYILIKILEMMIFCIGIPSAKNTPTLSV